MHIQQSVEILTFQTPESPEELKLREFGQLQGTRRYVEFIHFPIRKLSTLPPILAASSAAERSMCWEKPFVFMASFSSGTRRFFMQYAMVVFIQGFGVRVTPTVTTTLFVQSRYRLCCRSMT